MTRTIRHLTVILVALVVALGLSAAPALADTGTTPATSSLCNISIDKLNGYVGTTAVNTAVVSGCHGPQLVVTSVQIYPASAYTKGLCKATGKCSHVATYRHRLFNGTDLLATTLPTTCGLYLQVDHKNQAGVLIRAEHLATKTCTTTSEPKPGTPVTTGKTPTSDSTPTTRLVSSDHPAGICKAGQLACTGGFDHPVLYAGAIALVLGILLWLAGGFRRQPSHRADV